jgi:hypothetical protein
MNRNDCTYKPKHELVVGKAYRVHARNFSIATWNGEAFVGTRTKFGMTFEDTEFHWDDGPPHGTVKPYEEVE